MPIIWIDYFCNNYYCRNSWNNTTVIDRTRSKCPNNVQSILIMRMVSQKRRFMGLKRAAGQYAIDNNIERIAKDHRRALKLGDILSSDGYISEVMHVGTNIVNISEDDQIFEDIIKKLAENEVLVIAMDSRLIRLVTHLDYDDSLLDHVTSIIFSM